MRRSNRGVCPLVSASPPLHAWRADESFRNRQGSFECALIDRGVNSRLETYQRHIRPDRQAQLLLKSRLTFRLREENEEIGLEYL
jgi:hypothetical protein